MAHDNFEGDPEWDKLEWEEPDRTPSAAIDSEDHWAFLDRRRLPTREILLATGTFIGFAALGGAVYKVGESAGTKTTQVNKTVIEHVTTVQEVSDACPTIPASTLASVHKLLYAPNNPKLMKAEHSADPHLYNRYIGETAAKYGLTHVGIGPISDKIDAAKTPIQVVRDLNDYSRQMGFKISMNTKGSKLQFSDIYPIDTSKLRLSDFKTGAYDLLMDFNPMVAEETKAAGLKEIRIVGDFHSGNITENIGADAGGGVINVALSEFEGTDPTVYDHELEHLEDTAFCGDAGTANDPQYAALNPPGFEYGTANVMEDKAEMARGILGGISFSRLNWRYPAIGKKTELLVARLGAKVPSLPAYLAAISVRRIPKE